MPKSRPEGLLKRLLTFTFCASVTALGCQTPSPDWNGTWKLDPIRSGFQGKVLTISTTADGEYRFDESSSHTLSCDGKDRDVGKNRTLVCVKSGATGLDITLKENGVKTRATHDELSADGKDFTTTVTEFRPSGTVITSQITFSRLSGSDGFAGQWRDTSYLQWHTDLFVRVDNQSLQIDYPSGGEKMDLPLDGAEAAVRGPHALEGDNTCAARPAGNREFLMVTKHNGKVFSQDSLVLSSDGRTITDTWWRNPDRPDDKATLVYEKQ
jgi:hypothetical protein